MAVQKDPLVFVDLSLSRRPDFFEQIAALHPGALAPFERAAFGSVGGWLVSDMGVASELLSRSVGVKSRPVDQQARLGGVGAAKGQQVGFRKKSLVSALNALCRDEKTLALHVHAALGDVEWAHATGPLTEGLTASTITLATSSSPGSLSRSVVREAVARAWESVEEGNSPSGDALLELLLSRLNSRSAIVHILKEQLWTRELIAEEMRAMLLAGWGSTSAVVLSCASLGVSHALRDRSVFDEVLRLFPPSFMIARIVDRTSSGLPFAVGDTVVVSPWLIQRNPSSWADPLTFNPRRWEGELPAQPGFLPFGRGARRCPAQNLSRAQAREAVALLPEIDPSREGQVVALVEGRSPALIPAGWTVDRIYR